MIPGVVIELKAPLEPAAAGKAALGVCWRPVDASRSAFLLENGEVVTLGWPEFHQIAVVVGFNEIAAETLSLIELGPIDPQKRSTLFFDFMEQSKDLDGEVNTRKTP